MFAHCVAEAMSVEIAKAQAVMMGVKCALEKNVARVIIEVDSQIAYFALMRKDVNLSYFGGIVSDILEACKGFEMVIFSWIRRAGNLVAHCLARFGFNCSSLFLSHSIPEAIVNVVDVDLEALI